MKKALLCLAFAFCTAVGANAYAEGTAIATYNDTNDIAKPSGTTGNIENVIITDSETSSDITGDNIFYIDQASGSPLNAAAGFAMKEDAPNGQYYMHLGYDNGSIEKISFIVKNNIKSTDMPMEPLLMENDDGDTFSVAFVTNDLVNLAEYNTVKFAFTAEGTTGYFGYYLKDMKGKMKSSEIDLGTHDGRVFFGVCLTGIEDKYKTTSGGNVQMWLSKDNNLQEKKGGE